MNIKWHIAQLGEKIWWWKYLFLKDLAQYKIWKQHYWREFLTKIHLAIDPNAIVYDVGCGPSGIHFCLDNPHMIAIDPLMSLYQKKYPIFFNSPTTVFIQSNIEDYQPQSNGDQIFCINCINHVKDIDRALQVLFHIGKSTAEYTITTDCHHHVWLQNILKFLPLDILHPIQLNKEEYVQLFEKNGFKIEDSILLNKTFFFSYYAFKLRK